MGKHKNAAQEAVLNTFMQKHTGLAKGFVKGDRVAVDALWNDITKELNSQGPPQKDDSGWKKVWIDWKCNIRKKLGHNKAEARATGGGPFNKFVISPAEESVAKICGIYTVVEGIAHTLAFSVEEIDSATVSNDLDYLDDVDADLPGPSRSVCVTPRKRRAEPPLEVNSKKVMSEIAEIAKNICEHLEQNLIKQKK